MPEPPAKRARTQHGALDGVKVFVPPLAHKGGIPFVQAKFKGWTISVPSLGGSVTQEPQAPGITHVIVPEPEAGGVSCIPDVLQPNNQVAAGLHYVTEAWLGQSLLKRQRLPEASFAAALHQDLQPAAAVVGSVPGAPPLPAAAATMEDELTEEQALMAAWLGERWRPECLHMDKVELMLQACYDPERCKRLGNQPAARALKELSKYEKALGGDTVAGPDGHQVVNSKALAYAQAHAAVMGCAYRLLPPVRPQQLPFVGSANVAKLNAILETGTCEQLEDFRHDRPVRDSKGRLREDTEGAATCLMFSKLPCVGPGTARRWYRMGLRSFEDVERAAGLRPKQQASATDGSDSTSSSSSNRSGTASSGGGTMEGTGRLELTVAQRFSLLHREELLEGFSAAEHHEMRQAVADALAAASGVREGWVIEVVGGSRRRARPAKEQQQQQQGAAGGREEQEEQQRKQQQPQQHHDADFLVCHPDISYDGVIPRAYDYLVERGQLVPEQEAMCQRQHGHTSEDLHHVILRRIEVGSSENRDLFDHLYGMFRTRTGRHRRLDIVLAPAEQMPFALVGWIGGVQLMRFMRRHAASCGMHMNSHGLYMVECGQLLRVPEEAPPRDRSGHGRWPPGWPLDADGKPKRSVRTQEDVFALLGLPYLEPYQRET